MNNNTIIIDDLITGCAGTTAVLGEDLDLNYVTVTSTTPSITNYNISSVGASTITLPSSTMAWSQNYAIDGYTSNHNVNISSNGINMPETSDIKIGDKSIKEAIEKIEERLAILHPNPKLEEKWENLRNLRKAYMDLEAEIIEKEKMWEILKKP